MTCGLREVTRGGTKHGARNCEQCAASYEAWEIIGRLAVSVALAKLESRQ